AEHHGTDIVALRGQPVREAVGGVEDDGQADEPDGCLLPGTLARDGHHAASTRCASDTVKMPHASMRCSSLRKPAAATSWSISACMRRRMTQAAPARWLVSARAISSSCGCQGWPV